MTKKTVKVWMLVNRGVFIAALRFKPKRIRQGRGRESYYAWTDCNGPKYVDKKDFPYAMNVLEGSANAKCVYTVIKY